MLTLPQTQDQDFRSFDIRNYIEKLHPSNKKNKFVCPVCKGNDLSVNRQNGAYRCFNGCECKDIREVIAPWENKKTDHPECNNLASSKPRIKTKPRPIDLDSLTLARLKTEVVKPKIDAHPYYVPGGVPRNATETRFSYSPTQFTTRYDWKDENNAKGHSKTYRQWHLKPDGSNKAGKGSEPWMAYRLPDAIASCSGKFVSFVEGEPCVEALINLGVAACTFQGSDWSEKGMMPSLQLLKKSGVRGILFWRDNDEPGEKKGVKLTEVCTKIGLACIVIEPTDLWADMPDKGDVVDWINAHKNMEQQDFIRGLEESIHKAVERRQKEMAVIADTEGNIPSGIPNWSQPDITNWLAEKYRTDLAWNIELQQWYRYSAQQEGIWSVEPLEFIQEAIASDIEALSAIYARQQEKPPKYSLSFVDSIVEWMRRRLAVRKWGNDAKGLLPLRNGVLELATKKLIPHSPGYRLTWCLPYDYNPIVSHEPIVQWLTEMCNGDEPTVQLMRAYLLGVVTGRTDWQKYLELIGGGGTGKSTFIRLAIALVGSENTHTTTFKSIEQDRFETASIASKRLVVINDSDRYSGALSTFKSLTGQDTLRYEQKFKQSTRGFTPNAMVIVAANESIQSSDHTSGLERRRITIPMNKKVDAGYQRNLIEVTDDQIRGEFAPYIPGLLNWVLEIDKDEASNIIRNYESLVPRLTTEKMSMLLETNPIADWINNNLLFEDGYRTNVGRDIPDKIDSWLYPNYVAYCQSTGTKPAAMNRFSKLVNDLCQNQKTPLKELPISKGRDRYGTYFLGLRIRTECDTDPPIITGNLEERTMEKMGGVTNQMENVTYSVTAQSHIGEERDECDELFEKDEEMKKEEKNKTDFSKIESLPIDSSQSSQENTQILDGDESQGNGQSVTESSQSTLLVTPFVTKTHQTLDGDESQGNGQSVTLSTDDTEPELLFQVGQCVRVKSKNRIGIVVGHHQVSGMYIVRIGDSETYEGFANLAAIADADGVL